LDFVASPLGRDVSSPAREVCFLIGHDDTILWADLGGTAAAMPDSRARWKAIWERRDRLAEIAHSHPIGPLAFSHEDQTTMDALELALGRRIRFSVVAPDGMIGRDGAAGETALVKPEPWWAELLRAASGMEE
jgi:hypothetical protein